MPNVSTYIEVPNEIVISDQFIKSSLIVFFNVKKINEYINLVYFILKLNELTKS